MSKGFCFRLKEPRIGHLTDLLNERTTYVEFEDGSTTSSTDDWGTSEDPRAAQERFKGRTVFDLASVSTARKLFGKRSTLKPPDALELKPKRMQDSKLQVGPRPIAFQPLAAEYKATCRARLFQAS